MKEIKRPDKEVLERLHKLPTASVYSALWKLNYRNIWMEGIRPITLSGVCVGGPAITVKYVPFREEAQITDYSSSPPFLAIESASPGDVLVCDAAGISAGVFGDCMALGLKAKGGKGLIVDGCVRDVPQIKRMKFPVFARGATPAHTGGRVVPIGYNTVIQCGGVQIRPGDVILADDDGVVAIPEEVLSKVVEEAERRELLDEESRKRIRSGMPIYEAYPPREEWIPRSP